jgi:hypothetical protein
MKKDRIAIASAGPRIQEELHIPPECWGWILGVFVPFASLSGESTPVWSPGS